MLESYCTWYFLVGLSLICLHPRPASVGGRSQNKWVQLFNSPTSRVTFTITLTNTCLPRHSPWSRGSFSRAVVGYTRGNAGVLRVGSREKKHLLQKSELVVMEVDGGHILVAIVIRAAPHHDSTARMNSIARGAQV